MISCTSATENWMSRHSADFKFSKQKIYTLTWKGRFKESDIVDIEGLEISE